nr:hypothetical protein [Tanacetum cinerariifolium]
MYLLKHIHEVFETLKVFKNEVENQLGKNIKALRSDRGGEYISQEFKDYLNACGNVQNLTPSYTPQHNRVSKRRNHTLLNMGLRGERKLKQVEAIGSDDLVLPNGLVICLDNCHYAPIITRDRGGEYISQEFKDYLNACGNVQNLTPSYTPQHNRVSKRRNHTLLNMGCEALVKRDTSDKLQQRSVKCIFIGYPKKTMGYYFYFSPENKIVVARYTEFLEKNLISQEVSGRAKELEEIQDKDTSPSKNTSKIPMEFEGFEPPQ